MGSVVSDTQLAWCGLWTVDTMSTITIGIDTSRSYNRKVPPGGKCSDLFSSDIKLSEPVNKPRKIDRQRSSIEFAPDISEVTKGLERQISEPVPAKQVDLPSEPQDPPVSSGPKPEKAATKPTEIDGKIKSNGVEPKSAEAKPENSALEDASSSSEAKPAAVAELEVKSTEPLDPPTPSTKPKCSQPEITRNSSSDDVKLKTAQPKLVETPEPAKVEASQASQVQTEKSGQKVESSSCQPAPAPVRTA